MPRTRQRRAGDRVLGTWDGRYRSHSSSGWDECTIVDLSVGGAGVLLPPAHAVPGGPVDVDVRSVVGRRRSFVLRGTVRGAHTLPDGWQRLALEFTDATGRRQRRLERLLSRWR
jgi:hypothetical protein